MIYLKDLRFRLSRFQQKFGGKIVADLTEPSATIGSAPFASPPKAGTTTGASQHPFRVRCFTSVLSVESNRPEP